jgi:hypothetical protein
VRSRLTRRCLFQSLHVRGVVAVMSRHPSYASSVDVDASVDANSFAHSLISTISRPAFMSSRAVSERDAHFAQKVAFFVGSGIDPGRHDIVPVHRLASRCIPCTNRSDGVVLHALTLQPKGH